MKRTIAFMDDVIRDNGGVIYFKNGTALGYYGGEYFLYKNGDTLGDGIILSVEQAFRKFERDFENAITEDEFYQEEK